MRTVDIICDARFMDEAGKQSVVIVESRENLSLLDNAEEVPDSSLLRVKWCIHKDSPYCNSKIAAKFILYCSYLLLRLQGNVADYSHKRTNIPI